MIEVKGLCKGFDGRQVLHDVDAVFGTGRCNMIIGKSGSGKTVLLKNLIGLFSPDEGDILYDGESLVAMDEKQRKLLHQNIGVLFQGSALYDFATVLENVMFPMDFFTDWSYDEKLERARFCLDRVNITGSDGKYPSELSGGMQKRAALARALAFAEARNCGLILLDEPFAGLDAALHERMRELVLNAVKGRTTVLVTHDAEDVAPLSAKILTLE